MVEAPNYFHEARIKLSNAEMAQAYGRDFIREAKQSGYILMRIRQTV